LRSALPFRTVFNCRRDLCERQARFLVASKANWVCLSTASRGLKAGPDAFASSAESCRPVGATANKFFEL